MRDVGYRIFEFPVAADVSELILAYPAQPPVEFGCQPLHLLVARYYSDLGVGVFGHDKVKLLDDLIAAFAHKAYFDRKQYADNCKHCTDHPSQSDHLTNLI